MKRLFRKWQAFQADDSGQDMIEYALCSALIGLAAIASMKTLANSFATMWWGFIMKIAAVWPT